MVMLCTKNNLERPSLQLQQLLIEDAKELLDFLARVGDVFGELAGDQCYI